MLVVLFSHGSLAECSAQSLERAGSFARGEHTAMAVYRLFRNRAFEPEAIATMTSAYADVCRALGVQDRNQAEADAVAKKVIEFAQRGERDPVRLREHVLQAFQR